MIPKILTILIALIFTFPHPVLAADVPDSGILWGPLILKGTPSFPQGSSVGDIVFQLLPYVFGIAGFLILLFIILGGFQILTSQSDPKVLAAGQQKLTYAIVGFIVVFTAFWVVQLVANILDLKPIIDIFPG